MCTANTIAMACPQLSEMLVHISPPELRRFAIELCIGVAAWFPDMPEVGAAAQLLQMGEPIVPEVARRFRELSAALDRRADKLDEASAAGRTWFRKARCAYAISLAACEINLHIVHEILYELSHAADEEDQFFSSALEILRWVAPRSESRAAQSDNNGDGFRSTDVAASSRAAAGSHAPPCREAQPRGLMRRIVYRWWMWKCKWIREGTPATEVQRILGTPTAATHSGAYEIWFYRKFRAGDFVEGPAIAIQDGKALMRYWRVEPAPTIRKK